MKIVINKCFGGFGLSARAVKRLAELHGRECYFFINPRHAERGIDLYNYVPVSMEDAGEATLGMFFAFDVPNPNEVLKNVEEWHKMSMEDRQNANSLYELHSIDKGREVDRTDPKLVQVVEELGSKAASSRLAELAIVEIPDGVDWELDEYDGIETIHEKHRSWG